MASKNSRGSRGTTASGKATSFADQALIIPLNGGRHAYVYATQTHKNNRLATSSPEFADAIRAEVAAGYGDKVRGELDKLAASSPVWAGVVSRLDEQGALAAA